jgi:flagellar hook-basal body complex protein FliE
MSELGLFDLYTQSNWGKMQESAVQRREKAEAALSESDAASGPSFMESLESAIQETNETLMAADKASLDFASGKDVSLHEVLISMEKADVSLKTLSAVRGKIVEAYQEIMRMQV